MEGLGEGVSGSEVTAELGEIGLGVVLLEEEDQRGRGSVESTGQVRDI